MTAQFRSHNGAWRVASTVRHHPGEIVTVQRRNARSSEVIITALIAEDPSRELPYLFSFEDQRRASGAQPAQHAETILNADRLFGLFERAATRSHSVAVRFPLTNTTRGLRLELTRRGQLLALAEQRTSTGRRIMYGSLDRDGAFRGNVGATQIELDIFNEVVGVLRGFAAAPADYAAAHGHATGSCCFCGRGLTDARSVAVGYGPICADYYGLPWGDATAPAFDVAQGSVRQVERLADNAGRPNAFDGSNIVEAAAASVPEPDGVPTLEDIQNAPHGPQRMAMAAQRASAGLPNVTRDSMGRIVSTRVDMSTGSIELPAERSVTAIATEPVQAGQVVRTVRRVRPAAPLVERIRTNAIERIQQRRAAQRQSAPAATAPADETSSTVVRRQPRPVRPSNAALEEDDFIWVAPQPATGEAP